MSEIGSVPRAQRALLEVEHLNVIFRSRRRAAPVTAVEDVSLTIGVNETVGLVGESGSGKSTVARSVLGMARPTRGSVVFEGEEITYASKQRRRQLSRHLQVVFQDPYSSLSPTRTIGQTLVEPLLAQRLLQRDQARQRAIDMLARVGMTPESMVKYPSEFSGGQRQRIAIARALMLSPKLVICDEPVSALDLSVQAQVLNLLRALQRDLGLSYLFIAHNLAVVKYMSHRVLVLYRGRLMESGDATTIYRNPSHPYTRALLEAAPVADPCEQAARRRPATAGGRSPHGPPVQGCPFSPRCPFAVDICWREAPPVVKAPEGTDVACFRASELPPYQGVRLRASGNH